MIISHKHKFIFFKTKKTAGTSFEIALSTLCGTQDVLTPISIKDEAFRKEYASVSAQNFYVPWSKYNKQTVFNYLSKKKKLPLRFYPHISCKELKPLISKKIWKTYYKFTVERNPYDKVVSLYYWKGGDDKFGNIYNFLRKGGLEAFKSFDLYTINGVVTVDKIYRYENLSWAFRDLSEKLKLTAPLEMPLYRSKSAHRKVKDYRKVLDEKSINLIQLIFAREFRLLGYEY